MSHWLKPLLSCLVLGIVAGCGHTFYFESDTTGLLANIPIGEQSLGVMIGSSKTIQASVRGGSTFETSTTSGAGLFSGAGGVSKLSRMSTNLQVNEGNMVKIMTATNVSDEVKVELAKALTTAKAPPSIPHILQTATSTANIGTEAVSSNVVGKIDKTGVDLIVDKTPEVVHEVATVANNAIDSSEAVVSNVVTNNPISQVTQIPSQITGDVKEVVNNGVRVLGVLIGFIVLVLTLMFITWFISSALAKRKERKSTAKHASIQDTNPASIPTQDPEVPLYKPTKIKSRASIFTKVFGVGSFVIGLLFKAWFFIRTRKTKKQK